MGHQGKGGGGLNGGNKIKTCLAGRRYSDLYYEGLAQKIWAELAVSAK